MWILIDGLDLNGNAYWYGAAVFLTSMLLCIMDDVVTVSLVI